MKQILRTDEGPDIQVDTEHRLARADVTCGKTGKLVGYVEIYRGQRNLVVYIHDKRKKIGANREAFLMKMDTPPAEILRIGGGGYGLKEALRIAKMIDESVLLDMDKAVVDG